MFTSLVIIASLSLCGFQQDRGPEIRGEVLDVFDGAIRSCFQSALMMEHEKGCKGLSF